MSDAKTTSGPGRPVQFKPLPCEGHTAPLQWHGRFCVAVPAAPDLVDLDYQAVMASRDQLQGLFAADDPWPPACLTRAEDKADLAWHEREFRQGKSFAYSLLSPDLQECLGCLYLYPTASPQHDGEAYLWTSVAQDEPVRRAIAEEVINWLETAWPFRALAWPGRNIPFSRWTFANYYAERRTAPAADQI